MEILNYRYEDITILISVDLWISIHREDRCYHQIGSEGWGGFWGPCRQWERLCGGEGMDIRICGYIDIAKSLYLYLLI